MACIRAGLGAMAVIGLLLAASPSAHARPPDAGQGRPSGTTHPRSPDAARAPADFGGVQASLDARDLAAWIAAVHDHRGRPFAIVDKKAARLYVFTPQAKLAGASPVLLGLAVGDRAAPGLGDVPPGRIPAAQRTTPAGRFLTEPGTNLEGERVVWFDYEAGLAIHRLRPDAAELARTRRLATTDPRAHRVSAGCVVVPVEFYESVVIRWLGHARGLLYVLPEVERVNEVFAGLDDDL